MTELERAISLIKSGNKSDGGKILSGVVKTEPDNEAAWLWLSACVKPVEQRKYCIEQVLRINPNNADAKKALAQLDVPTFTEFVENTPQATAGASSTAKVVSASNQVTKLGLLLGLAGVLICCGFFWYAAMVGGASAKSSVETSRNDWTCTHDIIGNYLIEGVVRNSSETLTLQRVKLRATAYDASQNVVGTQVTYISSDVLPPKATSTFMFYINDSGSSAVSCSVEVEDASLK